MACQLVTRTVQEISVLPILMVSVVVPRPMGLMVPSEVTVAMELLPPDQVAVRSYPPQ